MKQEIRFCTSRDGTRIAYAISGSGVPLIKAPHWFTHLEHDAQGPVLGPLLEELNQRFRVVRFDQRGCGLSERDPPRIELDAWVDDMEAVADAAGLGPYLVLGPSQGAAIAVAFAARRPESVARLVLVHGYARGWAKRGFSPLELDRMHTLAHLIEIGWGTPDPTFRTAFSARFMPNATSEQQRSFNEMMRLSASPETAARIFNAFGDIDIQQDAKRVRSPCLLVHARGDMVVPFDEGVRLAALLPAAQLVPLETDNHIIRSDEPAWREFFAALDAFAQTGGNAHPLIAGLTERERDVLALMAEGLDNAQIAARLELSEKTVRNHITRIFDKIEVENRPQAIVLARKAGLGVDAASGRR